MNRNVSAQISYDRLTKGIDIRESSTAHFLLDSRDRFGYNKSTIYNPQYDGSGNLIPLPISSANFLINKIGQNLITGFFTRFSMTEIELQWTLPNITPLTIDGTYVPITSDVNLGNNTTGIVLSDGTTTTFIDSVIIARGNYTAKTALDALVVALNTATSALSATIFSLDDSTIAVGKKRIVSKTGWYYNFYRQIPIEQIPGYNINDSATYLNLSQALGFLVYNDLATATATVSNVAKRFNYNIAGNPQLNIFNYIDFTSSQLSSQQKLKDTTTSNFDALDVIYRWVLANDESSPVTYDAYGYPIIQGYLPFLSRRYINYPKQTRWDPLIPLSQLGIQVYTDKNQLLTYRYGLDSTEFNMLFLVSEV